MISLIGKGISKYSRTEDRFMPVFYQGVANDWLTSVVDLGQYGGLVYLLGSEGKLICTVNNRLVYSKTVVNESKLTFHKFLWVNNRYYLVIANAKQELLLYSLDDIEKNLVKIVSDQLNAIGLYDRKDDFPENLSAGLRQKL